MRFDNPRAVGNNFNVRLFDGASHGADYIRVYVTGADGLITEYCWDGGGWYTGFFRDSGTGATPTA